MFNEVINYKQIIKHEFWNFLKILLKGNRLRSEDKSKLARFVWELSSGSLIKSCDGSLTGTGTSKGWRQHWLAMCLFTFLYKNIEFSDCDFLSSELLEENINLLQEELHFKSLLDSLEIFNSHVEKELSNLHTRVCHSKLVHRLLPCLSDLSVNTLEKSMRKWPGITHSLINRILCTTSSFHLTNDQLFQIYKLLIEQLTNKLCTPDCDDNRDEYKKLLLSLITLCDGKWNVIDVSGCNSSNWINEGQLRLSLLLLAAISREDDEFYICLCQREDDYHNRKVTCLKNQKQDEMILCKIHNKLFTENGSLNISELFLRSIKNKTHWLEDVVYLYGRLLIDGDRSSVDVCFVHPLFLKLRPLLVFQLWMYSSASMNLDNLNLICSILDTCTVLNSDLVRLSEVLKRLKFVIEWVDQEVKVSIPDVNTLLGPARNQSILHLLKSTTDISQLNPDSVKCFLKQAHEKFNINEDINKELSIFEGFCIMTTILKGIFLATNAGKRDGSDFKGCHPSKKLKPIYEKTIPSTAFQNIREQINEVCSLSLRLEILENIFSLLFLRREYLREDTTSDSGAEDDDNNKQCGKLISITSSAQSTLAQSLPPIISNDDYLNDSNCHLKSSSLPLPTTAFLSSGINKRYKRLKSSGTDVESSEGFLCTNQLVNDLLVIVKDSLSDVTREAALLKVENKVEYKKIEPRLNRLSRALTAGLWRFEMLSKISTMDVEAHVDYKSEWIYNASEGSDSDMEVSNEKPISKRPKRSTESAEKSSESGSNTTGAGPSFSLSKGGRKLKKRKSSWKSPIPVSCSLINLMLASPSSLATYFLSLKDISGASSVIKKFSLEESKIAVEINFLISFENLKKKLQHFQTKVTPFSSSHQSDTTLGVINKAASAGFFTASVTKEVEQFLSQMPHLDVGSGGSRALVALDLALMLRASKSHSETLLGFAIKQCSTYAQNGGTAGTYLEHFAVILNQHLLEDGVNNPIPDLLTSLDVLLWNRKSNVRLLHVLWSSISIALASFKACITAPNLSDTFIACSELAQILNNAGIAWKGQNFDKNRENCYHQLLAYMTLLSRITVPHLSAGTPFLLLNKKLMDIMQTLIFEHNVDPCDMEQMLHRLGISSIYYLVQTCTPQVPIKQSVRSKDLIILNTAKLEEREAQLHPLVIVKKLLTSMITALQAEGTDFGEEEAATLFNKPSVQHVLEQTSQLADIDLSLISDGDEALVFFVNLMNLMWTHVLIAHQCIDRDLGLLSKSSMIREIGYNCVRYRVGKTGYISLHQLWSTLIQPLVSSSSCFTSEMLSPPLPLAPTLDPRILFAVANHHVLSPKLQVFDVIDLDNQLEWCLSDYIRKNVIITDTTISVPSLLQVYLDYTTLTQGPESEDLEGPEITSSDVSEERVSYLMDFLKENPAFSKTDIADKEIIIMDDAGFRLCIDYTKSSHGTFDYGYKNDDLMVNSKHFENQEVKESLLKYLAKKSPIVATLVQKLNSIESAEESLMESSSYMYLENELNSNITMDLSYLFKGDCVIAALLNRPDSDVLWNRLDSMISNYNFDRCLKLILILPEVVFQYEPRLITLKDLLYLRLSTEKGNGWKWCLSINNVTLMTEGVLRNLHLWNKNGASVALQTLIARPDLPSDKLAVARKIFSDISICQKVRAVCHESDEHEFYKSDRWIILETLLNSANINLAVEWATMHKIPSLNDPECGNNWQLIGQLILMLLESSIGDVARDMLLSIEKDIAIKICNFVISKGKSLSGLEIVVKFLNDLEDVTPETKNNYIQLDISVTMLRHISLTEQKWYIPLISRPDLIIEQMLMTTRLSTLENVIKSIESKILNIANSCPMSRPNLDLLLRKYALKAVDIRVGKQSKPYQVSSSVQSQPINKVNFTPPDLPPAKNQWVPDDEVTECMCCRIAVFSMFNRRHHCRRCGRVICNVCSSKTMKVMGYGNVPVRTCDDCFDYATPKTSQSRRDGGDDLKLLEESTNKPEWILSVDDGHNLLVREEFGYENAPSISLCLSILKLHSLDTVQPEFLIGICESMLSLLRPTIPGTVNPELDYALLVKMIRSLVFGAKVCYSGLGLTSGMAKCDQLLGEVDILNLLVTAHCCFLLPSFPLNNQSAIRNLRSNLLDQELWALALEVSTKAGLQYGSVWFAWGKACLRAGAWKEAREKFSHCSLQKKDLQNAGMLADILLILQKEEGSTALESRLLQLDLVATGKQRGVKFKDYSDKKLDENIFNECVYYLNKYGSHSQNLDFLLRHGDISQALDYAKKKKIEPEYFVENIYFPCLRSNRVAALQQAMLLMDPKLLLWKVELKTLCARCERREMFNTLFQLQLWMCDYIRATMTSIRFYLYGARSYGDLTCNLHHLDTALSNLQRTTADTRNRTQLPSGDDMRMALNQEDLNRHMDTVKLQIEITNYFHAANSSNGTPPFTLFGNDNEKIELAARILSAGSNVVESIHLVSRLFEAYLLPKCDVFCKAARQMVSLNRVDYICELCTHFKGDTDLRDQLLLAAVREKPLNPDSLINFISNISLKIEAYIVCGMLKAAYLLASKYNRLEDVEKVLIAAENLDQPLIKKICAKRLNAEEVSSRSSPKL